MSRSLNSVGSILRPLFAVPLRIPALVSRLVQSFAPRPVLVPVVESIPFAIAYATAVAVPVEEERDVHVENVPTAELAPVLLLTHVLVPDFPIDASSGLNEDSPAPSSQDRPSPLFVRRSRGYVPVEKAKLREGETTYRVLPGKGRVRYAPVE